METGPVMYTLDARQLEQARAILQREQQANTLSARQEKIFKLLNFAFYGLGIAWLANLLLRGMTIADSSALVAAGRAVFRVVLVINTLTYTLAAAITTLFFLNLPYLRRLLRQRQLARQVGLWAALCAPWKAERRRNQLRHALDVGIVTVGLLMVAGSVLGAVVAIPLASYDWVPLSLCLLLFVASGVIVATYFMRCSQERLGLLSRLHSSLEGDQEEVRQDQDRQIHIPPEAYEKIAEIERAQIARDRVQSILGDREQLGASPYVLQKSHAAQQAQAQLDATTRLRVQDQIDALRADPHPAGIVGSPETGAFRLRVPETLVVIGYTVDDRARLIQILSVESTADVTETSSEPGE